MKIRDMMHPDGRVFLKSEWGQIGDDWPCVSFTKKSVGDYLRAEFKVGRDVLVYVGTTNPEMTKDPDHRARLISATVIQPKQVMETRRIIPPDSWRKSLAKWGPDRWQRAMAVIRAANVVGPPYPRARDLLPSAYRSFAEFANRGGVVQATGNERWAAMEVEVDEITLNLSEDVRQYLRMTDALAPSVATAVKQEVLRMALLIQNRVAASGAPTTNVHPTRFAPNLSDLTTVLTHVWSHQRGVCLLCGGRLSPTTAYPMLQASTDRIDSANPHYSEDNVQITHLACNFAKNKYGPAQFREWLDIVRGEDEGEAT